MRSQQHSPLRVIVPLGLAMALSLGGDSTLYVALPSQPAITGITLSTLGWILGINRAVRIVLNPLAGWLYDHSRRRPLIILAMTLGTVSTVSYALVDSFWPLFVGRIAWGAAWALLLVGGYAIVLDVTTRDNRGRFTGVFQAWYFLGGGLGTVTAGVLVDQIGYRPTLWVCAALTGAGTLIAVTALPETGDRRHSRLAFEFKLPNWRLWTDPLSSSATGWRQRSGNTLVQRIVQLLNIDRRILAADYVSLVYYFVGNGVLISTMGLAVGSWAGPTPSVGPLGVASLTGLLLAGRAVLSVVAAPAAGVLSDWRRNRWHVIAPGMIIMLIGYSILAAGDGIGALIVSVTLISVGGGIVLPALTALVGDLAPLDRQGIAMGSFATAADMGSGTGPILAYGLISTFGLSGVYSLCAALVLTTLVILWLVRETG